MENTVRAKLLRKYLRLDYWLIAHLLSRKEITSVRSKLLSLGMSLLRIKYLRYFIALEIVRQLETSGKVLMTDSRDVIIQRDPFEFIGESDLISGLEKIEVQDCPLNSEWIRYLYGSNTLNKMLTWQIVCSGVTLGSVKKMNHYLSTMCNEIWAKLPKIATGFYHDQCFHNYLCFENKIPIHLTNNQEGIIATLGYEKNILEDTVYGKIKVMDCYPTIIHQYDRHPNIEKFLKEKHYFLNKKL